MVAVAGDGTGGGDANPGGGGMDTTEGSLVGVMGDGEEVEVGGIVSSSEKSSSKTTEESAGTLNGKNDGSCCRFQSL